MESTAMTKECSLKQLIKDLQKCIENYGMNKKKITASIKMLSELGYEYNEKQFPALVNTTAYKDTSGDSPSNLAEALLWKLGKWNSYKQFASNYVNIDSKPQKTDVVFYAFAKHLRDPNNPIYDQHAIRSLWAICGRLNDNEKEKCKSLLFDSENNWKKTGAGAETIECYELFVRHINELVQNGGGASLSEIDRLLMPLGQAIKKLTSNYNDLKSLCGW